jgi:hypothetical protein
MKDTTAIIARYKVLEFVKAEKFFESIVKHFENVSGKEVR